MQKMEQNVLNLYSMDFYIKMLKKLQLLLNRQECQNSYSIYLMLCQNLKEEKKKLRMKINNRLKKDKNYLKKMTQEILRKDSLEKMKQKILERNNKQIQINNLKQILSLCKIYKLISLNFHLNVTLRYLTAICLRKLFKVI